MPRKKSERKSPSRGISLKPGPVAIAIMAAGKGTRLKSKHPKVLHEVGGKTLLAHVIAAASRVVDPEHIYVIIGHEAERVRESVRNMGVNFVRQEPQRGTGHALMCAAPSLSAYDHVVVLSGDAPLIKSETISRLLEFHLDRKAAMTLLSATLEIPTGYGRVLRKGKTDEVQAVVEEKSCTPAQRKLREINSGFYAFSVKALFDNIKRLTMANPHGEYYLTDMAEVLRKAKQRVVVVPTANPSEILGSNTRAELVELDRTIRREKALALMAAGVTIFYPETCVIDADVEAGADTVIEPFVQILGGTKLGVDCRVRSYSVLVNSEIGDGVLIRQGCVLDHARVGEGAMLGPYSHLRPGSDIGEGAHVGNFVETKKAKLGRGTKANHLSYLGDAEIGAGVNIGAGTITCNYDGVHKHTTVIEDGVFVGSDSTLVAPLKLRKGSYVAAGSCITDDVPEESLALGRSRQIVKEQWVKRKREGLVVKSS
jgi:bifunctional UDP-N-acetylglucosamine pyrophosphorylase / glucosamine-1-phosphate N-acetyltransferase